MHTIPVPARIKTENYSGKWWGKWMDKAVGKLRLQREYCSHYRFDGRLLHPLWRRRPFERFENIVLLPQLEFPHHLVHSFWATELSNKDELLSVQSLIAHSYCDNSSFYSSAQFLWEVIVVRMSTGCSTWCELVSLPQLFIDGKLRLVLRWTAPPRGSDWHVCITDNWYCK